MVGVTRRANSTLTTTSTWKLSDIPNRKGTPVSEQHHKPCGTCPFTRAFPPSLTPGGSPLGVYVAQHFMPFHVPCHECVNYADDQGDPEHGWKPGAVKVAQCVGFAQTRSGEGIDQYMPRGLLKEEYREEHGAFRDIWDFYAHHKRISRQDALVEVRPDVIQGWCLQELQRAGRMDVRGNSDEHAMDLVVRATQLAIEVWGQALKAEFRKIPAEEHTGDGQGIVGADQRGQASDNVS